MLQGVLSVTEVEECLRTMFPLKSEEHLKALMAVVSRAASPKDVSLIKYHHLFPQVSHVVEVECWWGSHLTIRVRDLFHSTVWRTK